MATVDTKKASQKPDAGTADARKNKGRPPRRKRKLFFAFCLAMLLLVGPMALLPTLASWTPLGPWLVNRLAPVDGAIEIGSLSLGWFSPVAVQGIVLRNAQGTTVAEVAAAGGDKTLVNLLFDQTDLGHFEIDQPQLFLVLRADGSNLEDVFAPLLKGERSGAQPVVVALKIAGGGATVDDQTSQHKYQINDVATDLAWDGASKEPLSVEAAAKLVDANRTASVSLSLKAEGSEETGGPLGAGKLACHIDRLPLDVVEPLVRRRLAGAQLAGWLSCQLDGSWGGGAQHDEVSVQGQIDAADLLFAAPALGRDRIEMAHLNAPCQIVGTTDAVRIEKLLVDCDLGQVSATGEVRLADFAAGNLVAAVAHENFQLNGKLDLVRLVALLPDTLQIRSDTQITAGELNVALASQSQNDQMSWSGHLETSDLEAVAGGAPYRWQQPLAVAFEAHSSPTGPVVDKLNCDSSFLRVEAAGTLDQLRAGASFDLNRLAAELAQFVDLRGCQLAGSGQAQLTWQRDADGQVQTQADVAANDFALVAPGRRPWRESKVQAHLEATGTMTGDDLRHVDAASARLSVGDEQLAVQLVAAIDNPLANPWPVEVDWQGNLASLLPRLEVWIDLGDWDLAGQGTLHAAAHVAPGEVNIDDCKLSIARLHLWGHGLYVDEPQAEFAGAGRWQRAGGKIDIPSASLKGSAAIARLSNLTLSQNEGASLQVTGGATLEADLAGLVRWLGDPRIPPAHRVAGQLAAQAELQFSAGVSHVTLNATIDRLQVAAAQSSTPRSASSSAALIGPAAAPSLPSDWQEPRLTFAARIDYDPARDTLEVTQGELAGSSVQAQLNGRIAGLQTTPNVDLSGQVVCNWEQLAALWRPYVGDEVKIVGHEPWPFTLRGPWTSGATPVLAGAQKMAGQATIRWLSASVYGLDVSTGTLDARLADGALTLAPVDVAVSGGRLLLAPVVRLASQPADVELAKGMLLESVQVSQQVCAQALKYIAPVFAEVTRTEGRFSLSLEGGKLPLADPMSGDVAGQLQIQSVEMRPGPILQTLAGFAQQVEGILAGKVPFASPAQAVSLVRIENENVDFRLVDRRVYHRGLKFVVGNVTITTHGSVGLDESLAVLAEIPLTPKLLANNSTGGNLDKQSLQIPISGTLKNPKIDPKAIEQLPILLLKGTGRVLNRLEGTLEKLLPGQR